ncbi:MAG: MBL fold metallo-hydrolase [Thermosynechococcaceae cyanobacterium]
MAHYICVTCGTQFADTSSAPEHCPICEDERQYVGHDGQQWTTLPELSKDHHNCIDQQEDGLYGIGTEPKFAIGQRALLIQSDQGNVLWDCISLIDDQTIEQVDRLGGVDAIAISHPHYYASAVEWAKAFDATVYLHAADRQWMMRPDPTIKFWQGNTLELQKEITLIKAGGHFEGGTVCHLASGTEGLGTLLTGDVIQVVADKRWVSFMYSYPNLIPLPVSKVRQIAKAVEPYAYDLIYGAWWDEIVATDAKNCVKRSAERYIKALGNVAE